MFLWEGNYLAQTPVRQTGCDLHRMSVTGSPFRHVRSKHSVAIKVAILLNSSQQGNYHCFFGLKGVNAHRPITNVDKVSVIISRQHGNSTTEYTIFIYNIAPTSSSQHVVNVLRFSWHNQHHVHLNPFFSRVLGYRRLVDLIAFGAFLDLVSVLVRFTFRRTTLTRLKVPSGEDQLFGLPARVDSFGVLRDGFMRRVQTSSGEHSAPTTDAFAVRLEGTLRRCVVPFVAAMPSNRLQTLTCASRVFATPQGVETVNIPAGHRETLQDR